MTTFDQDKGGGEQSLVQKLRAIDDALVLEEESEASLREVLDTLERSPKFSRIGPFAGVSIAFWILDGGLRRVREEMSDALESLEDFEEKLEQVALIEERSPEQDYDRNLILRSRAVFDVLGINEIGRTILRVERLISDVQSRGEKLDAERRQVREELERVVQSQES